MRFADATRIPPHSPYPTCKVAEETGNVGLITHLSKTHAVPLIVDASGKGVNRASAPANVELFTAARAKAAPKARFITNARNIMLEELKVLKGLPASESKMAKESKKSAKRKAAAEDEEPSESEAGKEGDEAVVSSAKRSRADKPAGKASAKSSTNGKGKSSAKRKA